MRNERYRESENREESEVGSIRTILKRTIEEREMEAENSTQEGSSTVYERLLQKELEKINQYEEEEKREREMNNENDRKKEQQKKIKAIIIKVALIGGVALVIVGGAYFCQGFFS